MIRNKKYYLMAILALGCASLRAQLPTIPPSILRVSPPGVRQGSTVTLNIEGRSLSGAKALLFDSPGLSAKILGIREVAEEPRRIRLGVDLGAMIVQGTKQEARVELTVARDVEVGTHRFRIETPLGTSDAATIEVGALAEIPEMEPNDSPVSAQRVELPATLVGSLGSAGDVDTFQFEARAGQEVVFQTVASSSGSPLQSVLVLRDPKGEEVARAGEFSRESDTVLTFKPAADGTYTLSVSDLQRRGGEGFFYRLNAGALPYVTEVFPLGLRAGQSAEVEVKGVNLGGVDRTRVQGPPSADGWTTIPLKLKTPPGESLNTVRLGAGNEPEIREAEPNNGVGGAQSVSLPVTINGRINGERNGATDEDYFRFSARKGEHLTVEVAAARLGSSLDPVIEVLDAQGHEIRQATVRSLVETSLTLADRDSKIPSLRLTSTSGIRTGDYLMAGDEIVRLIFVPDQPDEDVVVESFGGERIALFNTSPQAHAVNSPVYKVRIADADAEFPSNGLPLVHLTARNDDGGPGYGADSRLEFRVPKDGEYILHIQDVRRFQGEGYGYRLTVRAAKPDFQLQVQRSNPNVPRGGRAPLRVTANRSLGYDGPIELEVRGLPEGMSASPAVIPAGQDATTVVLAARADTAGPNSPRPFQIVGRAMISGRQVVRVVGDNDPLQVVSLMPPPDVQVTAEPKEIILQPGANEVALTLHCERKNGFQGRVPYEVVNLPPGVVIVNIGFTGGFVAEKETSRTIKLRAEGWVQPLEQPLYVVGTVESNSPTQHASLPLTLKVLPKTEMARSGDRP